jgi:hypothetical protein
LVNRGSIGNPAVASNAISGRASVSIRLIPF